MKLNVTPNIHDDNDAKYLPNSYSSHHYGYHCGGHSHDYCLDTARNMAAGLMDANSKEGCTHYSVIELAIIPYPGRPGYYFVEDRSQIQ